MEKKYILIFLVAVSTVASGFAGYLVISSQQNDDDNVSSVSIPTYDATDGATDAPVPKDVVTVTVHDKEGNLVANQTTTNLITTAGAAFYCIQAGLCAGGSSGAIEGPNTAATTAPTYWVAFVNGTGPNSDEPTAADCSVSSINQLSGQTTGSGTSTTCIINFGSSPAQYPSGSSIVTLCQSATSCSGQLRASSAIIDTDTSNYVLATQLFSGCSPSSNSTGQNSGTCINAQQTSVFSNNIDQHLNIVGLGLFGGTNGKTAGSGPGPLLIAEATLSPAVNLGPGDTIQVTWQMTI